MNHRANKRRSIHSESMMVTVSAGPQLHLKRLCADKKQAGRPVFMVHGLAEDGHIFYSERGNGLAYFLAEQGFDVYVADLRGSGKSWPSVSHKSSHGHHETINQDIPALLRAIVKKRGKVPQIWVSHGWGGVLSASYFARFGHTEAPVQAMVYFGSRRLVQEKGWRKKLSLSLLWKSGLALAGRFSGYVPTRRFRIGSANETRRNFSDARCWMFKDAWQGSEDDYDYQEAAKQREFPASLYFACESDSVYGCPDDVRLFIASLGTHNGQLILLGKKGGGLRDYGHIGMLSDPDAESDHFPALLEWLGREAQFDQSFKDESSRTYVPASASNASPATEQGFYQPTEGSRYQAEGTQHLAEGSQYQAEGSQHVAEGSDC